MFSDALEKALCCSRKAPAESFVTIKGQEVKVRLADCPQTERIRERLRWKVGKQ